MQLGVIKLSVPKKDRKVFVNQEKAVDLANNRVDDNIMKNMVVPSPSSSYEKHWCQSSQKMCQCYRQHHFSSITMLFIVLSSCVVIC